MQKYTDNVVNKNGAAISGASVTVRDAAGNLATLYSDDGVTTQANPVSTDAKGVFSFYAADGTYTVTVTGSRIGTSSKIVTLISEASVATYAALRAFAGTSKTVNVTGYLASAAPSGIAGIFTCDDDDTTSADNGGTIIVASNGKRWKRVYGSEVDARWFGAKFDATYVSGASTGTDDTDAIQAAIDFALSMSGGAGTNFPVTQPVTVVLPAGDAIITDGLTANRRIRLRGQGLWSTRLICKTAGSAFYGFSLRPDATAGVPIWGAEVSDFQIVGDGGATRCNGLSTGSTAPYTVTNTEFRNLVMWNCATHYSIGDGADNSFYNNRFYNLKATGIGDTAVTAYGVKLDSAVYCTFEGIEVTGVGSAAYAIYGSGGWNTFTQIAVDGVCQIDFPHSTINGFAVEGIIAASTVAGTVLNINRIKALIGCTLIDCPAAKTDYGVTVISSGATVIGLTVLDGGGGQPTYPFLPQNSTTGALIGFTATNAPALKLELLLDEAAMTGWLWSDCAQLTDRRPGVLNVDSGSKPTARAGLRGQLCVERGGAGVADVAYVCRKNSSDAYEWQALA
jgi:hypothetical protein